MRAPLALCLFEDPFVLDRACGFLSAAGYDVLAFDDCRHAGAWLEEETPAVAVVSASPGEDRSPIAEELATRGVAVLVLAERGSREGQDGRGGVDATGAS